MTEPKTLSLEDLRTVTGGNWLADKRNQLTSWMSNWSERHQQRVDESHKWIDSHPAQAAEYFYGM